MHMQFFLLKLQVCKAQPATRAITWIELYVLYRLRGHPKPIPDPSVVSRNRATADKQIKQFKNFLRGTSSRILFKETADIYLRPAKASKDVLLGLATNGKHAQLNCNVHISEKEQQEIAHAIIMLTRTVSSRKARDFINNNCTLLPIDYKPRGKAGWDSTISNHAVQLDQDEVDDCTPLNPAGIPDNGEERCSLFYSCPKCGKVESSMCKSFQFNDLDKAHK